MFFPFLFEKIEVLKNYQHNSGPNSMISHLFILIYLKFILALGTYVQMAVLQNLC